MTGLTQQLLKLSQSMPDAAGKYDADAAPSLPNPWRPPPR